VITNQKIYIIILLTRADRHRKGHGRHTMENDLSCLYDRLSKMSDTNCSPRALISKSSNYANYFMTSRHFE